MKNKLKDFKNGKLTILLGLLKILNHFLFTNFIHVKFDVFTEHSNIILKTRILQNSLLNPNYFVFLYGKTIFTKI